MDILNDIFDLSEGASEAKSYYESWWYILPNMVKMIYARKSEHPIEYETKQTASLIDS